MNSNLVSVIVPTYRRKNELQNALLSLVGQTYPNVEIVVVDDNADEVWNSVVADIVNTVSEKSNCKIKLIENKSNLGSAKTRNVGINVANGEYITFLDDDDIYLPEKIEHQLDDFIHTNADYGLTDLYLYNSDGILEDKRTRDYITDYSQNSLLRYHLMYHMTGTDTLMFKSDYLRKIGGFPEIDVGDEFYLMQEAILGGGKLIYSPHCYVKAFIHRGDENGMSSGQRKIDGENALYIKKRDYFNQLSPKDIRYIKMRHYAVIAFAEYRRHHYLSFFANAGKSFFTSPIMCIGMLVGRT
ncbi:MAG: glycosyltransferase [Clostridia bacterium]|nr:glycosyltransferase [Clostridia bacterium]